MGQELLCSQAIGQACVFLDKDGTLLEDVPYNAEPGEMRFAPGAAEALRVLATLRMPLIVVSNQPGVALGRFPITALSRVETQLRHMFRSCGALLAAFYYCPHHPEGEDERYRQRCECRKPRPGLLLRAGSLHRLDLGSSWMIGDILDDIEAGCAAGCRTILVGNNHESISSRAPLRIPHYLAADLEEAAHEVARAQSACAMSASVATFGALYCHCVAGPV